MTQAPVCSYWGYVELAAEFGLSVATLRRRMAQWQDEEFPAPLPWSRREKRWDPASVRRWRERRELRAKSTRSRGPVLVAST
jgi:predicted DNA-binding transcriptional regulator AlpA